MKEFTDLAFTFMTSFLYYTDYDTIDEQTRSLYRQGISALAAYPDLPDRTGKGFARYRMGFPFAACHGADVLFLHAHG